MSGFGAPSRTATPMPVRPIAVHEPSTTAPCRVMSFIASSDMITTSTGVASASFALITPTVPKVSFTVWPVSFSNAAASSVTIERMAPALITWSSSASARPAPAHAAAPSTRAQHSVVLVRLFVVGSPRLPVGRRASHEPVELTGVLTGDLVRDVGGQVAELLLDVLRRFRPHAVGMRVVRAPHEGLDAHVVDQLGADAIELKRALALAAPVVARLHLQAEVAEAVLPLEVHPVERVGDPADAALAERDPDPRVALEDAGADDGGQDVDEVHLEAGHAGEERGAPGQAGLAIAHALGQRRERVEVEREIHVVHRAPERLPHRMPHGLHLPRARELEPAQPALGDAVRLGHGGVDVAVGQAREPDLTVGMMAAEVHEPVVVDPEHLRSRLVVGEPRGRAEDAEHDLGVHAVTLHVGDPELGIGRAPNALAAVGEGAGGPHAVQPLVLHGHVLLPGRAEATDEAEAGALLRGPVRPVGAFDHVRHR